MDLSQLKDSVKKMALDLGAVLAGIGSHDRLVTAPPSADMGYCLEGAQSCIIWAYAVPYDVLKSYFGKVERMSLRKFEHYAYSTGWATAEQIARHIEKDSAFKAVPVAPNGVYRGKDGKNVSYNRMLQAERAVPPFSLRYGRWPRASGTSGGRATW